MWVWVDGEPFNPVAFGVCGELGGAVGGVLEDAITRSFCVFLLPSAMRHAHIQ
jgi:hypothetical protein